MAFDWETFVKYGVAPAMQHVSNYFGADLESKLSTQKHRQKLVEQQYEYGLKAEEQNRRAYHDVYMKDIDSQLKEYDDLLTRNRILLTHDLTKDDWAYKANLDLGKLETEEDIKLGYDTKREEMKLGFKKQGYKYFRDLLKKTDEQAPGTSSQLMFNSLGKAVESLSKLQEMESGLMEKAAGFTQILALAQANKPGSPMAIPPDQVKAAQASLNYIQSQQLPVIYKTRDVLSKQIDYFNAVGVTDKGVVPPDRRDLLARHFQILQDQLAYQGRDISKMTGENILQAINMALQQEGSDVVMEPSDAEFLLAFIANQVKATFKTKKK